MSVSPDVVSEVIEGQAVLLNLRSGKYFRLNRTGTVVWQELERGQSPEAASASLAREFGEPEDRVRQDVDAILTELVAKGLVEPK